MSRRKRKRLNKVRGDSIYYAKLGRRGKGTPKTYVDQDQAREQRRLAGIASAKARRRKATLRLRAEARARRQIRAAVKGADRARRGMTILKALKTRRKIN